MRILFSGMGGGAVIIPPAASSFQSIRKYSDLLGWDKAEEKAEEEGAEEEEEGAEEEVKTLSKWRYRDMWPVFTPRRRITLWFQLGNRRTLWGLSGLVDNPD